MVGKIIFELIGSLGQLALELLADDNTETVDEHLARLAAVLVAAEKGLHVELKTKQDARQAALDLAVPIDE